MKAKYTKLLVSLLLVVPFLVGCALTDLFSSTKELKTEEEQKEFVKESVDKFKDIDAMRMYGKMTEDEQEMELDMKFKGEDAEVMMTMNDATIYVVSLGEYVYMGSSKDDLLRMSDDDETAGFAEGFTGFSDEMSGELTFDDEDWENEKIKYLGIEEVDGVDCYKFEAQMDEEDETKGHVYIDAEEKRLVKMDGGEKGSIMFEYDDIVIEEPESYEDIDDLSPEEQLEKLSFIFEMMGGAQ
jgi:hypothetical protein